MEYWIILHYFVIVNRGCKIMAYQMLDSFQYFDEFLRYSERSATCACKFMITLSSRIIAPSSSGRLEIYPQSRFRIFKFCFSWNVNKLWLVEFCSFVVLISYITFTKILKGLLKQLMLISPASIRCFSTFIQPLGYVRKDLIKRQLLEVFIIPILKVSIKLI